MEEYSLEIGYVPSQKLFNKRTIMRSKQASWFQATAKRYPIYTKRVQST